MLTELLSGTVLTFIAVFVGVVVLATVIVIIARIGQSIQRGPLTERAYKLLAEQSPKLHEVEALLKEFGMRLDAESDKEIAALAERLLAVKMRLKEEAARWAGS